MYAEWIDWHQKAVVQQNQTNSIEMDTNSNSSTSSNNSAMYQEVEDDEESSTTTEDNEDVETVKTAADLGKVYICSLSRWPKVTILIILISWQVSLNLKIDGWLVPPWVCKDHCYRKEVASFGQNGTTN